jgi:hypothetical protein
MSDKKTFKIIPMRPLILPKGSIWETIAESSYHSNEEIGDGMALCSASIPEEDVEEHLEKMMKLAISSGIYVPGKEKKDE